MDQRKERTRKCIVNAFLELRAKKPLERITVKELAELAMINKATFYSHYEDIYALSEDLEKEVIDRALAGLDDEFLIRDQEKITDVLLHSFAAQERMINLLFADARASGFADSLEKRIKERIFEYHPELKDDLEYNVKLTVLVHGFYYAYTKYNKVDLGSLYTIIGDINKRVLQ